jgi:predicted enzyme related to lactoylglutathione lyase
MITKIAFVAHPTRDMEKMKRFFGETLGLPNTATYGDVWAEFDTPDGKSIALDAYSPQFAEDPQVYLALETDDIEAEVERLRTAGTTIAKDVWTNKTPEGAEVCKMAVIVDPEGHGIMLHQIAPKRRTD